MKWQFSASHSLYLFPVIFFLLLLSQNLVLISGFTLSFFRSLFHNLLSGITNKKEKWGCHSPSFSAGFSPRKKCEFSWLDLMQLVRPPYCTSSSWARSLLLFLPLVSMWRLLSTRTSASLFGMSGVKTRFVHYGGTISRTLRVSFSWLIAMTEIALWRQEMSCIGC